MFKLIGKLIGPWKLRPRTDSVIQHGGPFVETVASWASEIDRNARAYGWEVGRGRAMAEILALSKENPFGNPEWVEYVSPPPK